MNDTSLVVTETTSALAAPERLINPIAVAEQAYQALIAATNPADVLQIEAKLDAVERLMRDTGLYPLDEMRPVNEMRMRARWCLGILLSSFERGKPGPKNSVEPLNTTSFRATLKQLSLDPRTALEAQRIAALPDAELRKAFDDWRTRDDLLHFNDLLQRSRPFWKLEKRRETHKDIAREASAAKIATPEKFGPFALIYADPPWTFEVYSRETASGLPDEHYPVLSDQEIIDFKIYDRTIPEIAQDDCALFLWCTSSNLERALAVMRGWGFTYKSQLIWDKELIGTGLIFRNQHEVLLYGTRGSPPKPLHLPSSVYRERRGKHSAKPDGIRKLIQKMCPKFNSDSRIELFCRGQYVGWTCVGFEAGLDQ